MYWPAVENKLPFELSVTPLAGDRVILPAPNCNRSICAPTGKATEAGYAGIEPGDICWNGLGVDIC